MTNEQLAVLLRGYCSRLESAIDGAHNALRGDDFSIRERTFVLLASLRYLQWELERDVENLLAREKPEETGDMTLKLDFTGIPVGKPEIVKEDAASDDDEDDDETG